VRAWRVWGGAAWGSTSDDAPCAGPVLDVLQGVGLLAPRRAHAVLRGAVGLVSPPSERELAAIRMLGRRFRVEELPVGLVRADVSAAARWLRRRALVWIGQSPKLHDPDDEAAWLALAEVVAGAAGAAPRRVGAVLVDAEGRLLAAAAHRTVGRRADHAELLLAQRWWSKLRAPFPPGARMYVTREPCRMCAAAVVELLSPVPADGVVFRDPETGPSSLRSALSGRQRRAVTVSELLCSTPAR
jgi:tRNA(Arg) A34 adenosine deaminase TadA